MSHTFPVKKFEWLEDASQFNEDFIKRDDEKSDKQNFLEFDVQYPEKLHEFHNDLSFLPEKMKIEARNIVASFHSKTEYVIHIRNLKQALNHLLNLNKVHRVIKFSQKSLAKAIYW